MVSKELCLQYLSTCDLYHLAMDEATVKGVSILSTVVKGVKGPTTKNMILDFKQISNQLAVTECAAAQEALKIERRRKTIEVSMLGCRTSNGDHGQTWHLICLAPRRKENLTHCLKTTRQR